MFQLMAVLDKKSLQGEIKTFSKYVIVQDDSQ